jgi:hypothetical protein
VTCHFPTRILIEMKEEGSAPVDDCAIRVQAADVN